MIQYGMPTLIENNTLEENAALCQSLGLKFIELNLNFPEYQVDRLEQTDRLTEAAGEKDVPFIMEHSEKLMHFHIHDGSEVPAKNHLALGDGEIDLADRLRLAECRNARCVLETKTVEALRKSVDWLRSRG